MLNKKLQILFFLILLIGVLLRFVGTNPGYNPYHADETMSYSSAWQMVLNHNLDPLRYDYPALVPSINFVLYLFFFIPLYWLKYFLLHQNIFFDFSNLKILFPNIIIGNGDLHALFWTRYTTALVSTLTLVLIYKFTNKLFNNRLIAFISMAASAVNFRIVMSSHFGLPDIYNSFFLILAAYVALFLLQYPTKKTYLLIGVTIGLSFAVKFQVFGAIPFLFVYSYTTIIKEGTLLAKIKKFISKNLFITSLAASITTLLFVPYHVINFEKFFDVNTYTLARYSILHGLGPVKYGLLYLYYIGLTPIPSIVVVIGVLYGLRKFLFQTLLLLSIVLPILYTFLYKLGGGALYTRNFVPVIPFVLIFVAVFLQLVFNSLARFLENKIITGIILIIVAIGIFSESFKNSFISTANFTRPWGMTLINQKIQQDLSSKHPLIRRNTSIAAHPWDFSVVLSKPSVIDDNFTRLPLNLNYEYSLPELQEEEANYALIGLDVIDVANSWWMGKKSFGSEEERIGIIKNQFPSLAIDELSQNTIFAGVKPWQTPDNNYIFVSIPKIINPKADLLYRFGFDTKQEFALWHKIDGGNGESFNFDSKIGYEKKGSVKITKTNSYKNMVVRIASPLFEVESGKAYVVSGWVKSGDKIDAQHKDGFLRLDFYKEKPTDWNMVGKGESVMISSRYFGDGTWVQEKLVAVPPVGSKYATISFQVSDMSTFWLDDIVISESIDKILTQQEGIKNFVIPDEVISDFSEGGL